MDFQSRDVLSDPDVREGVKKYSQWPTIPQVPHMPARLPARPRPPPLPRRPAQVYIDGEFVGGSDILMGLHQSGELEKLVKESAAKQ